VHCQAEIAASLAKAADEFGVPLPASDNADDDNVDRAQIDFLTKLAGTSHYRTSSALFAVRRRTTLAQTRIYSSCRHRQQPTFLSRGIAGTQWCATVLCRSGNPTGRRPNVTDRRTTGRLLLTFPACGDTFERARRTLDTSWWTPLSRTNGQRSSSLQLEWSRRLAHQQTSVSSMTTPTRRAHRSTIIRIDLTSRTSRTIHHRILRSEFTAYAKIIRTLGFLSCLATSPEHFDTCPRRTCVHVCLHHRWSFGH